MLYILFYFFLGSISGLLIKKIICKRFYQVSISSCCFELLSGVCFAYSYVTLTNPLKIVLSCLLCLTLLTVSFIDISTMEIPDSLHIVLLLIGILDCFAVNPLSLFQRIIGLFIGGSFLLLISILSAGNMGGGDIKLVAALGFLLGPYVILFGFFLSALIATIYSLPRMIKNRSMKNQVLPFGPFLSLTYYIMYLYGYDLLRWYVSLIFH